MSSTSETSFPSAEVKSSGKQAARRDEPLKDRVLRWGLGAAWSLKPPRLWGVPATLWMVFSHYAGLRHVDEGLPNPETALRNPDGLLGICNDLSVETLIAAYREGMYPFSHIGPQKWWAPSARMVLRLTNLHMEKSLKRLLRKNQMTVTFDRVFVDVMRACGEPRPGRPQLTWISPEMIDAYAALHEARHAHSVEVWDEEGALVGGAYGVAVGKVFFTESQFSRRSNASKIGFATLNCHLQKWGFLLNDGKFPTSHLAQAGFEMMPRSQFNALLKRHRKNDPMPDMWKVDETLDVGNWEPSKGAEQFAQKAH